MLRCFVVASLALLPACEIMETLGAEGIAGDTGEITRDVSADVPIPSQGGWTVRHHTCAGDGIDAMWWDADGQSVWIGCGSNASGYGLHHSPDRGETWPELSVEPRGAVGGRVNAISRSGDGRLYVAGEQLLGGQVVALDEVGGQLVATAEYLAGPTIDDVRLAGSFARNDAGVAVVEALNGTQVAVRWSDGGIWQDAAGWAGGSSTQMQHLLVHDDQFYGAGSTMNQAPMVFLPPQAGHDEAAGFLLVVVELSPWAQELRTLDVDPDGALVTGGVDHGVDSGLIYISNADPRDADDWSQVWVADLLGDDPTWIDGVCRWGDHVAAVGRHSTNDAPIALLSTDAGATWQDLAATLPTDAPLYRCAFLDDGRTVAVGGGAGFLGFYGF